MYKKDKVLIVLVFLVFSKTVYGGICFNLTNLECECKQFTDPVTHLPIWTADCSDRYINNIPEYLEEGINILDLSINQIQELDPAKQDINSDSLEELCLSYNNISYVDVDFFQHLPNLRELDLSNNFITKFENAEIFQNLDNLVRLDISFNNIITLPDFIFNPLTKLNELDISYNYLGEYLNQGKQPLKEKLGLTPNLTELSMEGLNISDLPSAYFDYFENLKKLSLADNELTQIPTVPYSLHYLDLSGNKLTFISAKYLNYHSLKTLKLNGMSTLTDIHHYAFYNLFSLEKLYITDCPNLKEFSELAFDIASKDIDHHPKLLSLARNGLTTFNETYKYFFKKMNHIDLTHNPWVCDCDIIWLQEFADELHRPHELRCNEPSNLKHKQILDIKPSNLKECFPAIYGKKSHRVLIIVLAVLCVGLCGLVFYLLRHPIHKASDIYKLGPHSPYSAAPTTEQI